MPRSTSIKWLVLATATVAIVVGCCAGLLHYRQVAMTEYRDRIAGYEQWTLANEIDNVASGGSQAVRFSVYTGPGTDEKIQLLERLEGLREIIFDCTDLSDAGLRRISAMGTIRRLTVRGSLATDAGLLAFAGNDSIESLTLVNTNLSDKSLKVLSTFRRLSKLVLYDEHTPSGLSLDGLSELRRSSSLRVLRVGGPWTMANGDDGLHKVKRLFNGVDVTRIERIPLLYPENPS